MGGELFYILDIDGTDPILPSIETLKPLVATLDVTTARAFIRLTGVWINLKLGPHGHLVSPLLDFGSLVTVPPQPAALQTAPVMETTPTSAGAAEDKTNGFRARSALAVVEALPAKVAIRASASGRRHRPRTSRYALGRILGRIETFNFKPQYFILLSQHNLQTVNKDSVSTHTSL